MNKEPDYYGKDVMPYRTGTQVFQLNDDKLVKKNEAQDKHSAHMAHRQRVPSIAKNIKLQADLNRLNLKTREDVLSKRNKNMMLMNGVKANRDRLEASHDFSSPPELVSDYQKV